jgi:hypothetical protein
MSIESVVSVNNRLLESLITSSVAVLDESQGKTAQAFQKVKPLLSLSIGPEDKEIYNNVRAVGSDIVKGIVWESEKASDMSSEKELREEFPTVRVNRCLELFEGGHVDVAMKWAKSTKKIQKLDLCKQLIKKGYYEYAVRVARFMGCKYKIDFDYEELKEVCQILNNKKQYDLAVELMFEIPIDGFEFYILVECQYLIEREQDDLAMKLATAKLSADYKFKLCEVLASDGQFDKVVTFASLIDSQSQIAVICENLKKQGQSALAKELAAVKTDKK